MIEETAARLLVSVTLLHDFVIPAQRAASAAPQLGQDALYRQEEDPQHLSVVIEVCSHSFQLVYRLGMDS